MNAHAAWGRRCKRGGRPILADEIARVTPEGRLIGRTALVPLFEEHISTVRLERIMVSVEEGNTAGDPDPLS